MKTYKILAASALLGLVFLAVKKKKTMPPLDATMEDWLVPLPPTEPQPSSEIIDVTIDEKYTSVNLKDFLSTGKYQKV